jgi:uncharacterized membrane protein YeaQ/YmgE (transglycosylase-associated protein family)
VTENNDETKPAQPDAPDIGQPGEIVISLDDLNTPEIQSQVESLSEAAKPSLVREVGSSSKKSLGRQPLFLNPVYGVVGALVGALILEFVSQPDSMSPWYGSNPYVGSLIYFGGTALFLGLGFAVGGSIETRSAEKLLREVGIGSAIMVLPIVVASLIAQYLYSHLLATYFETQYLGGAVNHTQLHIVRGLGWGMCAIGMGVGLGATKRSWRAVLNGAAAGLIGGFIGGFIFDYFNFSSAMANRVIACTIIGLLIGVAIGLISEVTKQHWIEIVSGGMAGKQFIVFASRTRVGASPAADITLIKDALIAPLQFEFRATGKTLGLTSEVGCVTTINGVTVTSNQQLRDGDLIGLGQTILRYRSKSETLPTLQ